ncbi:MAG: iron-sulfur cluster assembly accessory protein [Cyclobacteriaceae bacterium]|nr:iron-sulfur cluster assembly accessory protein [Cyclobacteriaceae bacterium]MCX7638341.1 iron-sulfur cluster assembly accessory protein [Cyclobacteriaceae bacterium]MDW8331136.1 iron-sulfur cluster biosynthesis family protein [Cyclobacteriaceae bacterium]
MMNPAFRPVSLSQKAIEEIKAIMQRKAIPEGYGLRVGVRGGGCGVSFLIGFDKPKENDLTYVIQDIPVYIDKKHTLFLVGKQVDFIESEEGRGFTFIEENTEAAQS